MIFITDILIVVASLVCILICCAICKNVDCCFRKRKYINYDIQYYSRDKSRINQRDVYGTTGLMIACIKNDIDVVKYLIKHKVNINETDDTGINALMFACKHNNVDIIEYLISHNADIYGKNNNGKTLLMIASEHGHLGMVQYCIKHNIHINEVDNCGRSAFLYAVSNNHVDIAKILATYATIDDIDFILTRKQSDSINNIKEYLIQIKNTRTLSQNIKSHGKK